LSDSPGSLTLVQFGLISQQMTRAVAQYTCAHLTKENGNFSLLDAATIAESDGLGFA
jgi:hypothetical protein